MNLGALVGKQSGRDLLLFRTPTQVNASSLLSITRTECPHKNPDENGNCRESQNQDGKVKRSRRFRVHAYAFLKGNRPRLLS